MHLYETHLPVADTETARKFYTKIIGLPFAYRDPTRDIVFLWANEKEQAMLGLWGPNTAYGNNAVKHHLAFAVSLDELFAAMETLSRHKIAILGFDGDKTTEPAVIGWMPSAQIYFRDPDGHMLEFITILAEPPRAEFNGKYSEWKKANQR